MEGTALLKKTIILFRQVLAEVEKAKASGATPEATVKALAAGSPELNSFLEIFVRRAFKELNGDLGDLSDGLQDWAALLISNA